MPTCPNGHQSGSDDWCEVCGHRMAGPGAPAGAVPPPPPPPPAYGYPGPGDPNATAQAELCPQCRTPREAMAPFCEECRYNFLTNTATSYTPVAPAQQPPGLNLPPGFQSQPAPPPPAQQQRDPYEYQGSRPSQMNRPAEPLMNDPSAQQQPPQGFPPAFQQPPGPPMPPAFQQPPGPPAPPAFQQQPGPPAPPAYQQPGPPAPQQPQQTGGDDWMLSPPSQAEAPQAPPAPQAPQRPDQFQQQEPFQQPDPFQQQEPFRQQDPFQQQAQQQAVPPQYTQQPGQPQGQHPGQQQPPQYQTPAGWTAVIAPDREYFLAMMHRSGPEATGLNLPAYSPEQHLPLTGNQIAIGRRRHSTGESPEIDLSVPPEDPGVSHQHAVLVQQPDGSWAVVDQNSTNGTTLNGAEDPIQPYVPIPLNDGDRVHVGAWTTITIRRG
ncbi:FHA domain-containing protein [Streptomyces lunaelactis]|uniref:FHA domain-containing protein n=2 Tax=Streptomyces lunaelactis TaxID=1535768 RepID=UPI001585A7E9|nr:FHA domain-containing protein [Streptomyces lunaelactis]NUK93409.1 FHA domain-containing protein [Streptomyces lunaelactis]NUL31852.1 FHA domain-containing protein [Streptomyces lunaelactis]